MRDQKTLSKEQRLILLASRLTFSKEDEEKLSYLKTQPINWYEVVEMSLKNKVLPLVWNNLKLRGFTENDFIPYRLQQVLQFHYLGTKERNKKYFESMKVILAKMNDIGVECIPLKGAYLIPEVYKDNGVRTVNDIDFLIKKSDMLKVREAMNSLDYFEGEYDSVDNIIKKPKREKMILWKTQMNSMHPFKKVVDCEYTKFLEFDFSFSLDFELKTEPVDVMVSRAKRGNNFLQLKPSDFFIHQCCHHYKEASNTAWVIFNSDINLIKFCDVREFIIREMNAKEFDDAISFAKEYGFEKAVYFTLFYLKIIYDDNYEEELLERLEIKDTSFLNKFGERDYDNPMVWKKDFWQRMFYSNQDELIEKPKFDGFVDFTR